MNTLQLEVGEGLDFPGGVCYCEQVDKLPFGGRMRAIRQGRLVRQGPKLTLAQVSKATGISVPHLSQIETGKRWEGRLPPGDDLQKIADALGVTHGELVGNEVQREESERLIAEERVTYDLEKERLAELGRAESEALIG